MFLQKYQKYANSKGISLEQVFYKKYLLYKNKYLKLKNKCTNPNSVNYSRNSTELDSSACKDDSTSKIARMIILNSGGATTDNVIATINPATTDNVIATINPAATDNVIATSTKSLIDDFYKDESSLLIIGLGYKVKVFAHKILPNYVLKLYENNPEKKLIDIEEEVNRLIMIHKLNDFYKYVKIPRLLEIDKTLNSEKHLFERIYNYQDTKIDEPNSQVHVRITNKRTNDTTYRGRLVDLDFIESIIGEELLQQYLYQLGQLFAQLNFIAQIKTDDIEIIFGKQSIDADIPTFYIVDFDRCETYDLDKYISRPTLIKLIENGFDNQLLGRKDYFDFRSIKKTYKDNFISGYMSIATSLNNEIITKLASNVIAKL